MEARAGAMRGGGRGGTRENRVGEEGGDYCCSHRYLNRFDVFPPNCTDVNGHMCCTVSCVGS